MLHNNTQHSCISLQMQCQSLLHFTAFFKHLHRIMEELSNLI